MALPVTIVTSGSNLPVAMVTGAASHDGAQRGGATGDRASS